MPEPTEVNYLDDDRSPVRAAAVRPRWLVLAALPLVALLIGGVLFGAKQLVQDDRDTTAQLAAANTSAAPLPSVTSSSTLPTASPAPSPTASPERPRRPGAGRSLGVISGKHQFKGPGRAPKGSVVVFVLTGPERAKHLDTAAPYRWVIDSRKIPNGTYKLTVAVVRANQKPVIAGVRSFVVRNRKATPAPSSSATPSAPAPEPSTPATGGTGGGTGGSGSTGGDPGSTGGLAGQAAKVLSITNAERAKAGCKPLTANAKLTKAAQLHSEDMATQNYFSHDSKDGRSPFDRMKAAGYSYSAAGENIAYGQPDADAVMTAWMNSAGHKANIVNCTYTQIGVGYALKGNTPYWTQDFGKPL